MFKSFKNREFELETPLKVQKNGFVDFVNFLIKIQKTWDEYQIRQNIIKAFFESSPLILEVKKHDQLKEKENSIRKRPNIGPRHNG